MNSRDGDLTTALIEVPLTHSTVSSLGAVQDSLSRFGFCKEDWHQNDNPMDVDWPGLCHHHQFIQTAIGSNRVPVSTLPPNVEVTGDHITHRADL